MVDSADIYFSKSVCISVCGRYQVSRTYCQVSLFLSFALTLFFIIVECLCKCKHGEDLEKCDIRGSLKTQTNQRRSADFINYSSSASPPKPKDSNSEVDSSIWKPLLLIIPLRLGLTETNVVYVESLKVSCD